MMLSACNLVPAKVIRIRQGEASSAPADRRLDHARGGQRSRDPRAQRCERRGQVSDLMIAIGV
jgi:hypothetical protein